MRVFQKKKQPGDFEKAVKTIIDYLYEMYRKDVATDQFIAKVELNFEKDTPHLFWIRNKKTSEVIRSIYLHANGIKPTWED